MRHEPWWWLYHERLLRSTESLLSPGLHGWGGAELKERPPPMAATPLMGPRVAGGSRWAMGLLGPRAVVPLAGTLLALLLAGPGPLSGQAMGIQGRLLADDTGGPIAGAAITLLDRDQVRLLVRLTGEDGAFLLPVARLGRYHLHAAFLGYAEVTSPALDVRLNEVVQIELRLSVEPIPLAPLTVISDRPALVFHPRLERVGYYERKAEYEIRQGQFFDYEEVQRHHTLLQLLSARPGLRILGAGGRNVVATDRRGIGVSLCIDGVPMGPLTHDVWVGPSQIVGVEVYAGVWQWEDARMWRCSVLVWTGIPGSGGR